jgi:hypothetical protein
MDLTRRPDLLASLACERFLPDGAVVQYTGHEMERFTKRQQEGLAAEVRVT